MTENVLTNAEKDALLDGVAAGEIEVQSTAGPVYATVRPFEIAERSRLVSDSYPRLQRLNQRLARTVAKLAEQLVCAEVEVTPASIRTCSFGQLCESDFGLSLAVEFSAAPLEGSGIVELGANLLARLVQAFYGGGNDAPRQITDYFTPGEMSVASRFGNDIIDTIGDVWRPVIAAEHRHVGTHQSTDLIEGLGASDTVICATFDISFLQQDDAFRIVWPNSMLAPLLPVFAGQKRDRDPAQDAHWARSLRSRLTESRVRISSLVGKRQSTLGAIAEFQPGDIIDIDDPRLTTVFLRQVPVLQGRFGVHAGKYAVEATGWLATETGDEAGSSANQL